MKNTRVTVQCAVCGTEKQIPRCWLKRLKRAPTCSRHCNGVLNGREWAKHGHKGWAGWSEESKQKRRALSGPSAVNWKGGIRINKDGYREVLKKGHPRAGTNGYVLEHILVAEEMLGRPLAPGEVVHHRDGNKANNDPTNLKVYASNRAHMKAEHWGVSRAARAAMRSSSRSTDRTRPDTSPS
jgi:endogenous inhibitor of DNA gyrase (YacG/DUF329 family)